MLWFRAPEKVYFKKGCLPVALNELKTVMGKKRVFIVTDQFLYKNGYTKCVTDKLDEMGIVHTTFLRCSPGSDTCLRTRRVQKPCRLFEPDCIIAIGGGSAMDAGKIMWVMYEHPEADFMDMAMRFMDIRKRIYTFPENGRKSLFYRRSDFFRYRFRGYSVCRYHRRRIPVSNIRLQTTSCFLKWQLLMPT